MRAQLNSLYRFGNDEYELDFFYDAVDRQRYPTKLVCGSLPKAHLEATGRAVEHTELVVNDGDLVCIPLVGGGYRRLGTWSQVELVN